MKNKIPDIVGFPIVQPSPEEQLKQFVKMWDDIDNKPVDDGLIRNAQTLKEAMYKLCTENDWQLPVLKRYYFDDGTNFNPI